ncbi:MAG: hypothetical protein ACI86M_000011 [Saprospiraceae bacterium]
MKVAIHQPNFLPWMGYFYKIAQCDTFVFFEDVEYTKRSFIRRVKIHKPHKVDEDKYLIVPLQKHSDFADIAELKLLIDPIWQRRIKAQIHQSYSKTPCYAQLESILDTFFTDKWEAEYFINFSTEIILHIARKLELECEWKYSSSLGIKKQSAEANIEIIKKVGGSKYISGLGAKKYQTKDQYLDQGIQLIYSDYPTRFRNKNLPTHFMNKSVISYLAWYKLEEIQELILHANVNR